MRLTPLFCALFMPVMASSVVAQTAVDIPPLSVEKGEIVACLDAMGSETTNWNQCMGLLFAPCADHDIGGADHLQCLLGEREAWLDAIEREQERTIAMITSQGGIELAQVMSQWYGYVAHKCSAVGANNAGTGADAAQAGCEIAEMASVVGELKSCSDGNSTSPYCVVQE